MAYTKRQFVEAAFEEIGLAAYFYDLQPDQLQSAVKRLDSMIAEWNGRGIRLGYTISSDPDLDTESGVPDYAWEAIILNLALKIAPGYGKQISIDTKTGANKAYKILSLKSTRKPKEMSLPGTLPLGAGNKPGDYKFVEETEENEISIGGDGDLILE